MQLFSVQWSFSSAEDQIYATREFCEHLINGKVYENLEGFELVSCAHMPQDGTGIIICRAENAALLFKVFNNWRVNFGITFEYKPALTNEELLQATKETNFWDV